jgi:hypothetical protein
MDLVTALAPIQAAIPPPAQLGRVAGVVKVVTGDSDR